MGEIVQLHKIRAACAVLVNWSDNPPTPDTADWGSLERALIILQSTRVSGPLGAAIAEALNPSEDPDALDQALAIMRKTFRFDTSASRTQKERVLR